MMQETIDRLIQEFGQPDSETDKVCRWHIRGGFDVIAQKDIPSTGHIWIPWEEDDYYPDWCELYVPKKGRHSNTIHESCPSLGMDRTALKMPVKKQYELNDAIKTIRDYAKV